MKKIMIFLLIFGLSLHSIDGKDKIKVVATTSVIADIVKNVGSNNIELAVIIDPNESPLTFKPSSDDIKKLKAADIIFYNGLNLESKKLKKTIEKIMKKNKNTIAITSKMNEERFVKYNSETNPYVWTDPSLWLKAIEVVAETLSKVDPDRVSIYQRQGIRYIQKVMILDQQIKRIIGDIEKKNRVLVTSQGAFNYFGKAYGLKVKSIEGLTADDTITPKEINEGKEFIMQNRPKAMFYEYSVPRDSLEVVQKEAAKNGLYVKITGELFSHSLGNPWTPEGTYMGMMLHNTNTIAHALGTDKGHGHAH